MNLFHRLAAALALAFLAHSVQAIEYVPTRYPIVSANSFGILETQNELVVCFDTEQGPLCGELNMAMFNLCQMTPQKSMVCPDT